MKKNGLKITTFCRVFPKFNPRTVREWCATEQVPSYRVGHNWYIDVDELVELNERNRRMNLVDMLSLPMGDTRVDENSGVCCYVE